MATRTRPQRKAKRTDVDYAVLSSGQQIPEYSSEDESSGDDDFGGGRKRKKRGKAAANGRKRRAAGGSQDECFICQKTSKSPFIQCDICSRLFHARCGRPFESASILGNTSCYECLQEATISSMDALPRTKLETVEDFVKLLKKAKKIVVIAGAGISVSCGIPDFRSKDGIYAMAQHMDVVLPEPECLFQIEYFREDPTPFFQIVRNAFANSPVPSPTHRFLKLLQDKKKLLRVYTQNIDGLEEAAGVNRVIPCHGSFAWSTCMRCRNRVPTSSLMSAIQAGVIPTCSVNDCRGVLKPDITFFGELLDDKVSTSITKDRLQADLLLVMGTSLKVAPVMEIPGYLPAHIPQVVINKTLLKRKKIKKKAPGQVPSEMAKSNGKTGGDDEEFDLSLLGNCDDIVRYICDQARWELDSIGDGDDDDVVEVTSKGSPTRKKKMGKQVHRDVYTRVILHKSGRKKVVCFGECQCGNQLANGMEDSSAESEQEPEKIVCNRCGVCIDGDKVAHFRCLECFDYDLCHVCYPKRKDRHKGGKHRFTQVL